MPASLIPAMKKPSISSLERVTFPKPLAKYENDLLTVENMAEVLDASTRTIYRLAESGDLPHVKVGRRLYFPKCQLIEFLGLGGSGLEQ